MDAFSYLSVLLSIVIGLAITQVLQGYRSLLLSRARVRLYGPPLLWSALVLVFATQVWWASFGLEGHRNWTFVGFGVLLLQTVLLYMMAALILPDVPSEGPVDLRAHYERETGPLFAILLAILAVSILKDWTIDGELPTLLNLLFHGLIGAVAATALLVRRPRVHQLIAITTATLFGSYIALLFARL